jgi:hypothetical protein
VLGRQDVAAQQQLLVQLLAFPEPDILDGDVAVRVLRVAYVEPHEANHRAPQVLDTHRLVHIEHKRIAARRHRAGLDDKRSRLGIDMK